MTTSRQFKSAKSFHCLKVMLILTVETENWECFESPQARSLPNRLMVIFFYPPLNAYKELSRQIEDLEIGIKYFFQR